MSREHTGTNRERSEYYGALQDIVNALFAQYGDLDPTIAEAVGAKVRRLDVVVAAEAADLARGTAAHRHAAAARRLHAPAPVHPAEQRHRRSCLGPGLRHGGVARGLVVGEKLSSSPKNGEEVELAHKKARE